MDDPGMRSLPFPRLSLAKPFSGQVRKDFYAIGKTVIEPAECLRLFERNCEYTLDTDQRKRALQLIGNVLAHHDPSSRNTRDIERAFAKDELLKPYAQALEDRGFSFIDKYTPRWSMIYGLLGVCPSGAAHCEVGCTERTQADIISQLRSPRSSQHQTRLGAFLALVRGEKAECHFLWLECTAGTLDDAGAVKEYYRRAAYRVGLRPTHAKFHRPYLGDERYYLAISQEEMDGWNTRGRIWPGREAFQSVGSLL